MMRGLYTLLVDTAHVHNNHFGIDSVHVWRLFVALI